MNSAEKAIRAEIDRREKELASLRQALAALTGGKAKSGAGRSGKRRPKTAAEKKVLSEKLKAAWKRRKSASKKSA